MALIEKYIVNNIQCIAEKIAADMRTSLSHHGGGAKNTTTCRHNLLGCLSCSSEAAQNRLEKLHRAAELDKELSGALADFGVNSGDRAEFGLWRAARTELADYSLDRTSFRLPVTWSAMKTASHSCSAACSRQDGRQLQSCLFRKTNDNKSKSVKRIKQL